MIQCQRISGFAKATCNTSSMKKDVLKMKNKTFQKSRTILVSLRTLRMILSHDAAVKMSALSTILRSSLSIASLRILDGEANKFYVRKLLSNSSSYLMSHSTCSSTIH